METGKGYGRPPQAAKGNRFPPGASEKGCGFVNALTRLSEPYTGSDPLELYWTSTIPVSQLLGGSRKQKEKEFNLTSVK